MQKWEYITVEFQLNKGEFKPGKISGKPVDDWENGQSFDEFCNLMGEQGWDMVPPSTITFVIFKRPK